VRLRRRTTKGTGTGWQRTKQASSSKTLHNVVRQWLSDSAIPSEYTVENRFAAFVVELTPEVARNFRP
jgi:hypothetical protein